MNKVLFLITLVGMACTPNKADQASDLTEDSLRQSEDSVAADSEGVSPRSVTYADVNMDSLLAAQYEEGTIVTGWSYALDGEVFDGKECREFVIAEVKRENNEGQFIDWRVLYIDEGEVYVSSPVSSDITEQQSTVSANLKLNYTISGSCPVIAIEESFDGGDIDVTKRSTISFYTTEQSGFSSILSIDLEKYHEDGLDGSKESVSKTFTILSDKTNEVFDIQVDVEESSNDEPARKSSELYQWDGKEYQLKIQ